MTTVPVSHTVQLRVLLARLAPLAARAEVVREHWIAGLDESLSYCEPCAILRRA